MKNLPEIHIRVFEPSRDDCELFFELRLAGIFVSFTRAVKDSFLCDEEESIGLFDGSSPLVDPVAIITGKKAKAQFEKVFLSCSPHAFISQNSTKQN